LAVGSLFSLYVYNLGLTRVLVDQNSHLNISRQITDSITDATPNRGTNRAAPASPL